MFQKPFAATCVIFLAVTLLFGANASAEPNQAAVAQSQPAPEDFWDAFIGGSLAVKFNAVATECQKDGWPGAASVETAYNDSMVGIVGVLNKKNGELRAVLIYQGFRDSINELNSATEIEKMAAGMRSFCGLAHKMAGAGLLMSDAQINFVWTDAEKALAKRFADRASELVDAYAGEWEELEPMLNTPISRPHFEDGKKYILIGVKIYNPKAFGASERWVVTRYPMEEINEKNLDAKVRDALEKITAYLTEQPYLKVSGVE